MTDYCASVSLLSRYRAQYESLTRCPIRDAYYVEYANIAEVGWKENHLFANLHFEATTRQTLKCEGDQYRIICKNLFSSSQNKVNILEKLKLFILRIN